MTARDTHDQSWTCQRCGQTLGTVDRATGTLYVTMQGAFVEIGYFATVHCPHPCYATKRFAGQRVIVRPGASTFRQSA